MLLQKKVKDIKLSKVKTIDDLARQFFNSGGFSAKKVGIAVNILEKIEKDKDCVKFLSFPADIIATGTRGVIKDLIKEKLVDVVITTCGTLDHDIARNFKNYFHGEFEMDDVLLHKKKINRLGNILIPTESYTTILEKKMQEILQKICKEKNEFSTKEIIWDIGKYLGKASILYWAEKNKIPIFVPGIIDGAFGSQLWMFKQRNKNFNINLFKDEDDLAEIIFKAKRSSALMIGGGISKHHVIWWNQFKDGLDYCVYITTAVEYNGSLSGARIREGISWGKVKENAKQITVEGDATILLPLMVKALKERL